MNSSLLSFIFYLFVGISCGAELPSYDDLEEVRDIIVRRAKEINEAAEVSLFKATGRMPAQDSIPNADCILVPKKFLGGNRAMIYRRVNKSGSQTVLGQLRRLTKELTTKGTEVKFQSFSCDAPELDYERSNGAVDFAIVREPLDRWVSGYFFLGRASPSLWENLVHYAREMMQWEWDAHGLPQAYFYTHKSRREKAHSAVIKLENIAQEWPALVSLVIAGTDDVMFQRAIKVSLDVQHSHRNDGDKQPHVDNPDSAPRIQRPPGGKNGKESPVNIKKNPLGGGPGSGLRFVESRSKDELAEFLPHLCAYLEHDYALLRKEYQRPQICPVAADSKFSQEL
jgi:hypothetical protein